MNKEMTDARKKAEDVWPRLRSRQHYNNGDEACVKILTAALTAEREETIKECGKWMRHTQDCLLLVTVGSHVCTCGLAEFKGEK